jgi:hypothetical protein
MKPLAYFIGPNGDVVTLADLPSPKTIRWVIRRKAEVVLAVRGGLLGLDEACTRYHLTAQEFYSWHSAIEKRGLLGEAPQMQQSSTTPTAADT